METVVEAALVAQLQPQFPEVTAMLVEARDDLLAFSAFPRALAQAYP